jgi:SAM-dependent methyltransferase
VLNEFQRKFFKHLGGSPRWNAFLFIAKQLLEKEGDVWLCETGCARWANNWHGDGQSTQLWDWILEQKGGTGFSVDIEPRHVEYAKQVAPRVFVTCADSIRYLAEFDNKAASLLDLLFLDSYDYGPDDRYALSELHHAGELAAIYERLKPGCLVAVDDCHTPEEGKQRFVKLFFKKLGVEPIHESYITVWKKPQPLPKL